ncbi:predicted protein [Lichtheimia corymbifera JMRC:FSU:9682]|uniref:Uncharacterized protein n=1 Tax=Lichtheimia corymbifera JMRC:FSU:9682 TaxID=1263082 RepID=A0A068RGJ0_9FUNG|nr:predicted protein [Lichtheimia corymbifera JMRC:FSU:9682]
MVKAIMLPSPETINQPPSPTATCAVTDTRDHVHIPLRPSTSFPFLVSLTDACKYMHARTHSAAIES